MAKAQSILLLSIALLLVLAQENEVTETAQIFDFVCFGFVNQH